MPAGDLHDQTGPWFWIVEENELRRLERVMRRLFTEQRMNGDDMRDAAQTIAAVCKIAREIPAPAGEPPVGLHAAAFKIQTDRVARLEALIEELAEDCDQRADADCTGDPPRYVPNFAMELLTKIRATVPR
jgi:hypothetical protein